VMILHSRLSAGARSFSSRFTRRGSSSWRAPPRASSPVKRRARCAPISPASARSTANSSSKWPWIAARRRRSGALRWTPSTS
jgi:hypothetical protein